MNAMEKMMIEEKKILKEEILKLFNSLNKDNFLSELDEIGFEELKKLGSIHSYKIDLEIDSDVIYVYLDNKVSLRYKY